MNTTTADIQRRAIIRLYEIYTEATDIALAAGMTKDEAAAAVASWLDAQLDGGAR
jgi:hypothetical protein